MPTYWLSLDIGLTTSYEHLFAWLDDHTAVGCGDNVASFKHDEEFEAVAKEIASAVQNGGTRLYLIGRLGPGLRVVGRFIKGRRKAGPWVGLGADSSSNEEDEE